MPARNSPMAGPSRASAQNMVGDALYEWCRNEKDFGYVFVQDELLNSNIIPDRSLQILMTAVTYLVNKHLLKLHDIKGQEGVGWELVSPDIAQNYDSLDADEQMVYAIIGGAGAQGEWIKTIQRKTGVHSKVLDRVYKSLEQRKLIKRMKSVKNHAGKRMYILYNLQPSEEATGGAWFTEGTLDVEMIDAISQFVEIHCSTKSWREVRDDDDESDLDTESTRKRKHPDSGFDPAERSKGKSRADNTSKAVKSDKHASFEPYEPGYNSYPTLRDISKALVEKQLMESGQVLPDNALTQLLDVMVYDDRLYKMYRNCRSGERPDDVDTNKVVMYRSFKTPHDLRREKHQQDKIMQGSRTAMRQAEIEDIGRGGSSEVPCLGCPNFDICGDGGQINAETCVYFDSWYQKMEDADREVNEPWPSIGLRSGKSTSSRLQR